MTYEELSKKTVLELRKIAKEYGVILGAGISKEGIINKLTAAIISDAPVQEAEPVEPENKTEPVEAEPVKAPVSQPEAVKPQPQFKAAWHNTQPVRHSWQRASQPVQHSSLQADPVPRPAAPRPAGYTPRFGPDAIEVPAVQNAPQHNVRQEMPRSYDAPRTQRPGYAGNYSDGMISPAECTDCSGVFEPHPEGYGFIRTSGFLPSSQDVYVSPSMVRSYKLRTGDWISGKSRLSRENSKMALAYLNAINGVPAENVVDRPDFDQLTPVYPSRRINIEPPESKNLKGLRMIDLVAPLGFGQRSLVFCSVDTVKLELMSHLTRVIALNHPEAHIITLLLDGNPEDVTIAKGIMGGTVTASTFDQPPENHIRMTDLVLEYAERLVEMKQDVVLVLDSLTRLAKVSSSSAQQNRPAPGTINANSLYKAKHFFGAARACTEGGSLTIIGFMSADSTNKIDEALNEEFRGTANMQLAVDTSMIRAGVNPPVNLQASGTRRVEGMLDDNRKDAIRIIRKMIAGTNSAAVVPQIASMMDKVPNNTLLIERLKEWAAMQDPS